MKVFITGATGFLGNILVQNLTQLGHDVYVLARNQEKANNMLEKLDKKDREKVSILYGDITLPQLGLDQESLSEVKDIIDVCYHMAALVKFDVDLRDKMLTINYEGTRHVLELAKLLHIPKFYYVSTAYTVGKKEEGREELYPLEGPFNNPYEESKCMAEHLIHSYQEVMDISIFRPAIIIGDSKSGKADSLFTLYGFIRGLEIFKKRISKRPDWKNKNYYIVGNKLANSNFVPVDYVSDVLTAALHYAKKNQIYHITNPKSPTNKEILHLIKELLDFSNLSILSPKEEKRLTSEESLLNELISVYKAYLNRTIRFCDKNTQKMLSKANMMHLNMDEEMLKRIIFGYRQS